MARRRAGSFDAPDERNEFPLFVEEVVDLGDASVSLNTAQPGWRWSSHIRPAVGGEWCRVRHVGVVVSGRMRVDFEDGTTLEIGPLSAFDIPPGHDGATVGDEPLVTLEWAGTRGFVGSRALRRRLVTLLFTDIVDSTATVRRIGDEAWRALLSSHYEAARGAIGRHGGREIATTGDGLLATFDAPAHALRCAAAIRSSAAAEGLHIRAGVHVGEVELVGDGVRGVAVHEAARILGRAGTDEILVSETTRTLALPAGLRFDDRGLHELKGLDGEWRLYAYAGED